MASSDLIGATMPIGDLGSVRVVDLMGDDDAICQAARVSYGRDDQRKPEENQRLIRYLMRHRHTSPFEMCEAKFSIEAPLFVARQWLRHRTANVNEISGRYVVFPEDAHVVPGPTEWRRQSRESKQGSDGLFGPETGESLTRAVGYAMGQAAATYRALVEAGVAKEQARVVLPLSTKTRFIWKIDLHNLLHFIELRADPHAQQEIRLYADALADVVARWCPVTWQAFRDYRLIAHTFSGPELDVLRDALADRLDDLQRRIDAAPGLTDRERREFLRALGG